MDILLRYVPHAKEGSTGKEQIFNSREEVQKYFLNLHKKDGNDNFIFFVREKNQKPVRRFDTKDGNPNVVNENDNIYFAYREDKKSKTEIIAKAIYVSMDNPKRKEDDKFNDGYKVRNVILLGSPYPLDNLTKNPFSNQNPIRFIPSDEENKILKKELKELFK